MHCLVASLADQVAASIAKVDSEPTARTAIIKNEEAAISLGAVSRSGDTFQLGLIATYVDDIVSRVPEGSGDFETVGVRHDAIKRALASIANVMLADRATADEIALLEFYGLTVRPPSRR
jgi:hypothetical protein